MSAFDKEIRKAFSRFLKAVLKNPARLFDRVYVQSIHLQQPIEIMNGLINLCDDCVNMMVYNGRLVNSCRLDEYRMFGEMLSVVKKIESDV